MLRSFCASSFPKAAPCRSALFPLPPASKPLMSPGSHRDEQKISLILPCSSALPTFASRSFPLLILSPRSSRNALSISTPVPRKSGSVTSTDRCPFLSLLIINKLPLLCFARRSLTGFPDHLARSPDIFARRCRPHPLPVRFTFPALSDLSLFFPTRCALPLKHGQNNFITYLKFIKQLICSTEFGGKDRHKHYVLGVVERFSKKTGCKY